MEISTLRPRIEDMQPVTDFRARVATAIQHVQETQRPVVLTQNGHSAAVLLDIDTYAQMVDELELRRGLTRSEEQSARGELIGHEQVMADMRARRTSA